MTPATKRAVLVVLVALGSLARPHQLPGQETDSAIDALLTFVEEDVRTVVPPEMRPYEIGRLFLRMDSRKPDRGALGSVGQRVMERVPVELVSDTISWTNMLVTGVGNTGWEVVEARRLGGC